MPDEKARADVGGSYVDASAPVNPFVFTLPEREMRLLHFIARSLTCDVCLGTGLVYKEVGGSLIHVPRQEVEMCACRHRIREALAAG